MKIPNPYTTSGPAIGDQFLGRDDIMQRIQELWSGPGPLPLISLYGPPRMGKTSILCNLRGRFPLDGIVFFNMQRVCYAESTSELLYNLALAIYGVLPAGIIPRPERRQYFEKNPFVSFEWDFIGKIHPHGQKLIVAIDEVEIVNELIDSGFISKAFPDFLRSLANQYPWLLFILAANRPVEAMGEGWATFASKVVSIEVDSVDMQ